MKNKELKTLNDLNIEEDRDYNSLVNIDELKAEAVKWVKEDFKWIDECDENKRVILSLMLLRWINRFNITEEELK